MSFNSLNDQLPIMEQGNRLYKGQVVDNNDPLHLDRVKVRIPNLFDPDLGEIPWIFPIKHSQFGQGNGYGHVGVPPIGALVFVLLVGIDANFSYYIG